MKFFNKISRNYWILTRSIFALEFIVHKKGYAKGSCQLAMISDEKLEHLLRLRSYDLVAEAANRGQELSFEIAYMRAVGQYNRDPKAWMKEWNRKEKKVRLF